ncbi:MAG: RES family NAD+ phosphorylase [Balneolaceae bacterium]|nr:RES family NAD+ phosphorylase [Balneolaceae bacterium]MDR9408072.1 RES family NAD+ phosphorylase [Balneolaceae bacterium]
MGTIRVWWICRREYKDSAFSGEGAKLYGGRFNSEGLAAVYTSGSLSLSLLEMLVQVNDRSYLRHCLVFQTDVPESLVDSSLMTDLPDRWNQIPYGHASQNFGDDWLSSSEGLALKIPSVVVPIEHNYVLNPNHPDFRNLQIEEMGQAGIDQRLFT